MEIKKAQPYNLKVISTNAYSNLKTINRYIITAKPLQWIKKGDYKSPLKKSNFWFVQKPMLQFRNSN